MTSPLRRQDGTGEHADVIEQFYDRHPYPPPTSLDAVAARGPLQQRAAHHLIWPERPPRPGRRILVAGCGTSQAVRHAILEPDAEVVGIDVSTTGIQESRKLAERHRVNNLTLRKLPIEEVGALGQEFHHVICTGVLHHLADPDAGLRALRQVLAPGAAITLMVYAPYGRTGVYLIQDYCRRLGLGTGEVDLADLIATLREIPTGHPISRLLRETRDFADDDALADALLNPRDRAYSVPQLFDLLTGAGLRFGRWSRQAPYLPDCGSISETPHGQRISGLPSGEQYAALELFRGTMVRHTAIAFATDDQTSGRLDFADPASAGWRPIPVSTAIAVTERLPKGAAAALLNRAHTDTDLVMFVNRKELDLFRQIDGERTLGSLSLSKGPQSKGSLSLSKGEAASFVERLFRHDLVVMDASGGQP